MYVYIYAYVYLCVLVYVGIAWAQEEGLIWEAKVLNKLNWSTVYMS